MPFVTPDLSQSALTAMQWMDRVAESRTGVNRSAQPMDPDILHDTAKGVELLQNAASIRKEEIARNLALAHQLGVQGTPTLIWADGTRSEGFVGRALIEARLAATTSQVAPEK